jgi:AraC-like DNA-binding protein
MTAAVYGITAVVVWYPQALAPGPRKVLSPTWSNDEKLAAIAQRVRTELADGAFKDPGLSLHSLAAKVAYHPNEVSRAVNKVFGERCTAVIHRCRLDYFIRRALSGALEEQCILSLALEAGFPSKSTFNRAFTAFTGVSPSHFAAAVGTRRLDRQGVQDDRTVLFPHREQPQDRGVPGREARL